MLKRPSGLTLTLAAVAAVATAGMAGCTATPAPNGAMPSGGQCFLTNNVNSFNANADGTVDVQVGASQYFRLTPGGGCPDINWAMQVGIRSTSGSNFVCSGYDAEFVIPDPSGTQRCPIASITPITKAQYDSAQRR